MPLRFVSQVFFSTLTIVIGSLSLFASLYSRSRCRSPGWTPAKSHLRRSTLRLHD
jgi:hypothetical protein